jgi:exodeoxyribonuclease V alpha subunit
MELTPGQMGVLLDPKQRVRHRVPERAGDVMSNPYLICERFVPNQDDELIGFLTVDHALVPHESMSDAPIRIPPRDPRRFRALLTEVLRDRAADGDTFVAAEEARSLAMQRSPEDRPCDVPLDRLGHPKVAEVVDKTIERFSLDDVPQLALREIRALETRVEDVLDELVLRPALETDAVDWQAVAERVARRDGSVVVELSEEQQRALDRMMRSAVSVLTGAAGTGKSTLLAPLIAAIREREGHVPIRALAPTTLLPARPPTG